MPFQSGYDIIAYPKGDVKSFYYGMACSGRKKDRNRVGFLTVNREDAVCKFKVAFSIV
jgi:hypothetical protein